MDFSQKRSGPWREGKVVIGVVGNMLTKLTVRNFKRFDYVVIDLADPVVFFGPNNSGKTSAMQALALWEIGVKRWNEKHAGKKHTSKKRPGVTVNRLDLLALPHPSANLLWRNCHTRDISRIGGRQKTANVRIEIIVEGITRGRKWECGFEFDYANRESFYCRPLRTGEHKDRERMAVPDEAALLNIAFLPPMSGLSTNETRLDPGAVNVRIGEGRTAEVLRNLCWRIWDGNRGQWDSLVREIKNLFGVELEEPIYIPERSEITMSYREGGCSFDLSSSGRGLQQTLLLLSYMRVNQDSVILLDEPDAHLEILRQRGIYRLISDKASELGIQIIAASHSEVILNEAADKDLVIAFVGRPHRLGGGTHQVRKSLSEIGWEDYYQAEQKGWVLYLEGSTDLAILQAFARRLRHEQAMAALELPFVHYVRNDPRTAARHFFGLREAIPGFKGVALFDRIDTPVESNPHLNQIVWKKREIENYLCTPDTLKRFVEGSVEREWEENPIFMQEALDKAVGAMDVSVSEVQRALRTFGKDPAWSDDIKASDDFLIPVFRAYHERLGLPNITGKSDFHKMVEFMPEEDIDPEVTEVLNQLAEVANSVEILSDKTQKFSKSHFTIQMRPNQS